MSKKKDVLVLCKDDKASTVSPVEEYFAYQLDFEAFRKWREGKDKWPDGIIIKGTGKPLYKGAVYPFTQTRGKPVTADLSEWKEFANNSPHLNPNPRVINPDSL